MVKRDKTSEEAERMWREFGLWIEDRRRHKGMTQDQAAKKAGILRGRWNEIAHGKSTKRTTVIRMAAAVGADKDLALDKAGFRMSNNERKAVPERFEGLLFKTAKLDGANQIKLMPVIDLIERDVDRMLAEQEPNDISSRKTRENRSK